MAKVLIVEPDIVLAHTYGRYLQLTGHAVQYAATAQAAIQSADECLPDVVLLELQLVAHSGLGFLYEFRSYADWQTVPVVVLSHVPAVQLRQSARQLREFLGVRTHLYKPRTTLKSMADAVQAALSPAET